MGEAYAAILTGALHLLFENVLHQKLLYIVLAGLGWSTYLVVRARQDPGILRVWGFRADNLRRAMRVPTAFFLLAGAALAAVGAVQGTLRWHTPMLALFLLYPLWGWIQQLLVQAMFVRNAEREVPALRPPWRIVPLAALLFGVVHFPDVKLMGATFLMGLAFTPMYLRWRNLWPLGLYHGWLGVLAYYWLLDRDPWTELFG